VLTIIEQRRCEGSSEIMGRALVEIGLLLTRLQNMLHRLVGETVVRDSVMPTDACEQWAGMFATNLIGLQH